MKKIKNTLKQLWRDESGQGATEYILILVVVSVLVIVFKDTFKTKFQGQVGEVSKKLTGAINSLGKEIK